jgi:prepilin-type N-terminal cleavage/methylation domain-containing protein
MWAKNKETVGFTIIELLVVIVVIGILAGIIIVAYTGIQSRASDAAVQSDLNSFHNQMAQQVLTGSYPLSLTPSLGFKFSRGSYGLDYQNLNLRYCVNPATNQYILYAISKSGNYFRDTSDSGVAPATLTYGWGICSQIGLINTNPVSNGLNNTTWDVWVN